MRNLGSIHKRLLPALGATAAILLSATMAWADATPNHVHDVKVRATDTATGAAEIEVVGTTAPIYNLRVEGNGRRLVVDITDADVTGVKEATTFPLGTTGVVGGIMT